MPRYSSDPDDRQAFRDRLLAIAGRLVDGQIGVIEAARLLSAAAHEPGLEAVLEVTLRPFVGIDSETDALPIGDVRRHWQPAALAREDLKILEAENHWQSHAFAAAHRLIEVVQQLR